MKIEAIKPGDYEYVANIYNTANKPFLEIYSPEEMEAYKDHLFETPESIAEMTQTRKIFVAKDVSNKIVGYVAFRIKNEDVVWLSSLFIDPVEQRKGVGKELLNFVENFSRENNCKLIALETHKKAEWAIKFYLKNGYSDVREKITEYPYSKILEKAPVEDRPLLAKNLK